MLDTILFFITEYFLYSAIMIITLIGAFYFRSRCDSYEGRRYMAIMVVTVFLVMFGGLGGFIKPYFTDTSKVSLTYNGSKYWARGTGSFINPNTVLTNEHVVRGCKNLAIADKNNIYLGRLISTLEKSKGDLAFIRTPANRRKFAIISNDGPKSRDILIFPNYTSKAGVFDKAKGLRTQENKVFRGVDVETIQVLSPKGRKGNSGAPLYNKKGYLVGVIHSGDLDFFSAMSIASPVSIVQQFAQTSGVNLYYLRDNSKDLTKIGDFKDNFAVNVLCAM